MPAAVRRATRIQIGKFAGSNHNAAVAATRRMIAAGTATHASEQEDWEELMSGTLARTARAPTRTREGFALVYTAPLSFEEILWPLLSGVKGNVSPVNVNSEYTWTFSGLTSADPAPDSYTVEWVESDLTDNYERESAYCMTSGFRISAADGGAPNLEVTMFGRKAVESTMTGSIAVPTVTTVGNARWKVYINNEYANINVTPINAQVYGFDLSVDTGVFPQYYLDNRDALDFSIHHFREHVVDLTLNCVINAESGGIVRLEQAKKENVNLRFVAIRLSGPNINGTNAQIDFQCAMYHAADSMIERGADRDGNMITTMHLMSALDPTTSEDLKVIVKNSLSAFP